MALYILADRAMEPLKDMFPRRFRNWGTGIANRDNRPFTRFLTANANASSRAIIFSRILEQVLQDQCDIVFLTCDLKIGVMTFNLEIHTIRQCAEVVYQRFQEMGEVHRTKRDSQP